jgi:murein DD-endopeptidase MepM/ murein hydrolase activator NlpD
MQTKKKPLLLWAGLILLVVAVSNALKAKGTNALPGGKPVYRGLVWPVDNKVITLKFAATKPTPPYSASKPHRGLDIDLRIGDSVASISDGLVTHAQESSGLGKYIVISTQLPFDVGTHALGGAWQNLKAGTRLYVAYGHLSQHLVKVGDHVQPGQVIAKGGNTGLSIPQGGGDGSHLHLEIGLGAFEARDVRNPFEILVAAIPGLQSQVMYV